MRIHRLIWTALSLLLLATGGYLLVDSLDSPGKFAEERILLGGTLIALALVSLVFAVQQQMRGRSLANHLRSSSRVMRKRRYDTHVGS